MPLVDQQAEHPAGAQHPGDRGERRRDVVDDLEHPVAEHHVGSPGGDQVGQGAQVALLGGDPVGDPGLGGPPAQDRQGVGTRVDDRDPVAELGGPDGETAGAAADVDHLRRPGPVAGFLPGPGEDVAQGVPDHRGARGTAPLQARLLGGALVSRHAANPRG